MSQRVQTQHRDQFVVSIAPLTAVTVEGLPASVIFMHWNVSTTVFAAD
jgi:hypothetical protein